MTIPLILEGAFDSEQALRDMIVTRKACSITTPTTCKESRGVKLTLSYALRVEDIARLERGPLRPEEFGLTLAEAKALLHGMQEVVVTEQIAECLITSRPARTAARTGFGKDNIPSRIEPRSGNSTCQGRP
jgi:hypothetical protein